MDLSNLCGQSKRFQILRQCSRNPHNFLDSLILDNTTRRCSTDGECNPDEECILQKCSKKLIFIIVKLSHSSIPNSMTQLYQSFSEFLGPCRNLGESCNFISPCCDESMTCEYDISDLRGSPGRCKNRGKTNILTNASEFCRISIKSLTSAVGIDFDISVLFRYHYKDMRK